MTGELKKYIAKIHNVPDRLLEDFLACWKIKSAIKKDILTHSETIDKYLYFTTKGIQKAFYVKDGTEFNIAFTYPFAFTCVPESFLTQKPSKYTYQCITDSEFLVISHEDFFHFVDNHHEFETLLRKTLLGTLNGIVNRYHRLLTLTIEERFLDFMRSSPALINQINHKEIANYLKIDPSNFSKLLNTVKI
ncbi:MAG: cyclic nucleotide-binding domain-containing protein [Cyclobacteriaceae bacterium]